MSNYSTLWKKDFMLFLEFFSCVQANMHITCFKKLKMKKNWSFKFKLRKEKKKNLWEKVIIFLNKEWLINRTKWNLLKMKYSITGFNLKKLDLWIKDTHRFLLRWMGYNSQEKRKSREMSAGSEGDEFWREEHIWQETSSFYVECNDNLSLFTMRLKIKQSVSC